MDSAHYINEKTHHIDELSMRPSEMDLVAILHNPVILVPILSMLAMLTILAMLAILSMLTILAITLDKYSDKRITYILLDITEEEIGQ